MIKKFIFRITALCTSAAAGLLLFSGLASAHVTVQPGLSSPGAWETYSLKVPVEKDIPTVKVSLKIPDELDFKQYRPVPDWTVELTKNESGKVTVVTWASEADGIGPGEFQQFEFVGKNPADDTSLAWDAFQYYSDGSIVEWSGEEGSDKPHSITTVTADAAVGAADGHAADQGHDTGVEAGDAADGNAAGAEGGNANAVADKTAGDDTNSKAGDAGAANAAAGAAASDAGQSKDGGASGVEIATMVVSSAALLVSLAALWAAIRSRTKTS
ncbi:YcnI family protein [Paenibacillus sp. Marseille-P2973]|uniref:YcnI family copper-binding membrane protein n=1 Tax=Paenibacillus sp. Marseille-P2973 TaxID=1871032 RepID=UPI001B383BE6|nr:YcnI family protein [Paenibacillus sp. Marseille-P2973]MBQ4899630.1 YcnI family protein [Paenibacillus sp. Marseille-P2973]